MKHQNRLVIGWFLITALGCRAGGGGANTSPPGGGRSLEVLNAVLWVQQSGEALAACKQAYALAELRLEQALADKSWTAAEEQISGFEDLPPAVILDVDETVLDNSFFQARVATTEPFTPEKFRAWINEGSAPAIEGAQTFCARARKLGVTVFYVTNRSQEEKAGTLNNLVAQRFPIDADGKTLICKSTLSDKGPRRLAIAEQYRILLLIGDNAGDFASGFVDKANAERRRLADERSGMWGSRWIVLPNAMYGDWENVSGGRSVESKLRALRPSP